VNAGCVGTGSEEWSPFYVQDERYAVGAWTSVPLDGMRRNGLLVTVLWRRKRKHLARLGEKSPPKKPIKQRRTPSPHRQDTKPKKTLKTVPQ